MSQGATKIEEQVSDYTESREDSVDIKNSLLEIYKKLDIESDILIAKISNRKKASHARKKTNSG